MTRHVPVLLAEVLDALQLNTGMNVIDCTVGDAGHSEKIIEAVSPGGTLLAIDADPESLIRAKQFLSKWADHVTFARSNFEKLEEIIKEHSFGPVHGILMDFGWSTPQFKDRKRGFSFEGNEPLDMRYGAGGDGKRTAAEIVNEEDEEALIEMFWKYGEEKLSKEIAANIIEKRKEKAIETTGELVEIILQTYRTKLKTDKEVPWIGGLHPATKVFQALRIAVNDEFGVIERVIPQAIDALEPGGRLAVISFHSGEDRIVKHLFKEAKGKTINVLTKKPITCGEEEHKANPPSRSAKLRVIEKK